MMVCFMFTYWLVLLIYCRPLVYLWSKMFSSVLVEVTKCYTRITKFLVIGKQPEQAMPLKDSHKHWNQWFPTWVPGPLGSETRFSGVRNAIFEGDSLYVLGFGCMFFQKNEIYESLQVLLLKETLSRLIILVILWCKRLTSSCKVNETQDKIKASRNCPTLDGTHIIHF